MPRKDVNVNDLMQRMNHAQIERFQVSGLPLDDFLNQPDEMLITETIAVLGRVRFKMPVVTLRW